VDHYFSASPTSDREQIQVELKLSNGDQVEIISDRGVFSSTRIDPGTAVLLDAVPVPDPNSTVLDLGCGYGAIALWCAAAEPTCRVYAIDVNERARELCAANAEILGLNNISVHGPSDVASDQSFDRIYSNPPARIGKDELHEILLMWIRRLNQNGQAFLVVQKHLGSDSLAAWLDHEGFPTERIASKRAYRVLAVTKP